MSCEYRLLLFLIFFDPITVCDLPSSPPPPLVPTVTYGYLPKLSTTHLPAYYHLPYWYQYWWFWLCLQTLGTLCPSRLVPLALFGLTEPSDPLRFVRPQPKARLSLSTIHFPPLPPPTPHPSFGSSVHPKSNHPNNCSTELYSLRPKRFFIPRLFSLHFLSLFPPSRYRLNRTTLLLPFHIPLNSIALPTTSYRLPSSPQISRDVTE